MSRRKAAQPRKTRIPFLAQGARENANEFP
jgi:hypothetical protein